MNEQEHTILKVEEIPALSTGHSQVQFVASTETTGSSMAVIQGTLRAGGHVPLHSHADPECFYVVAGEMEVYQDRNGSPEWSAVREGGFAVMHSNVKHAWRNSSNDPCVCLIVTGADVFAFLHGSCEMLQTAALLGTPPLELVPNMLHLAAATHCWLATPEENEAIGL